MKRDTTPKIWKLIVNVPYRQHYLAVIPSRPHPPDRPCKCDLCKKPLGNFDLCHTAWKEGGSKKPRDPRATVCAACTKGLLERAMK